MVALLSSDGAAKFANLLPLILPVAGALSIGIFILDLFSPLGWLVWSLYLLPLFLTFWFSHQQYLIPFTVVSTALIVIGFIHSYPGIPVEAAAFNRSLGVAVLWITTLLLQQHKQATEALRNAHEELELRVQERTSELRRTIDLLKREDAERQRAEDAFHTSLQYFQAFMDNSPVVAFMKDEEGRYVYANRTWERVFHKTSSEVVGKTDFELWPPETAKQLRENDRAVFAAGYTIELEELVPTTDGTPHTWIVFKFMLQGPAERRMLGGVALDITERKQAEEARRESEERYRQLIELCQDAIYIFDDKATFTLTNPAGCTLLRYTEQELVGMSVVNTYLPEERPVVTERLQQLKIGSPLRFERDAVRKDGTTVPIEVSLSPMTHGRYQAVVRDITERKQAEEALRNSEQQLRLALEERERLSQDLHDNIIQTIYAIGMNLEECHHLIKEDTTTAHKKLRQAIADLNVVIRDVRTYIIGTESKNISAKQLRAQLTWLARTGKGTQLPRFRLRLDQLAINRLTPEEVTHVFFIAREAMSNSLRHSRARTGVVSLQTNNGCVRFEVEDDGTGFDPQAPTARGHGLRNIASRVQKLGAHLRVVSELGHGTRIIVDIPKKPAHVAAGD